MHGNLFIVPPTVGGIKRYRDLCICLPWRSCRVRAAALDYRHAGCLQLSHVRTADPSADGRRSAVSQTSIGRGIYCLAAPRAISCLWTFVAVTRNCRLVRTFINEDNVCEPAQQLRHELRFWQGVEVHCQHTSWSVSTAVVNHCHCLDYWYWFTRVSCNFTLLTAPLTLTKHPLRCNRESYSVFIKYSQNHKMTVLLST